jgi:acetyl-CoA synthetase
VSNLMIAKPPAPGAFAPNLADYDAECRAFSWEAVTATFEGLPGGGLNIAHEAVTRHARPPYGGHVALRFIDRQAVAHDVTFAELSDRTDRLAGVLGDLGVGPGERVFTLLGRTPELYVTAMGTLKHRSVFCPLFSAFGPEPVLQRMSLGDARVLVTTPQFYTRKVLPIREQLPGLRHVLLTGPAGGLPPGTESFDARMAAATPQRGTPPTSPSDPALLHFTSGTTGRPKGALHVHGAITAHVATARYALDLHPDDVFWCTADPGWVTGTSYGIVAPLALGVTSIVDELEFDAARWYEILERERVSVWYTAPTALRMLMKAGAEVAAGHDLSGVRFAASVGEPLNPEVIAWAHQALGLAVHDNWWQTETGGVMIANYAAMPIRAGSMGKPLPGIGVSLVERSDGGVRTLSGVGEVGEIAIRTPWPSMFRAYLNDDERYRACFADGWYLSGDLARVDEDGYFWFIGRSDDVIKSAGHLIGPFEVESALMEHPAVLEAAIIGKPDPVAGTVVKAFVALKAGFVEEEALRLELLGFARKKLGPAIAPREIAFVASLPKTRSGKILRRLLKARELGLPEGDLSTLENA